MNEQTDRSDQTDEDIIAYTVSDDVLEAAAGTERRALLTVTMLCPGSFC
jgi:hypothetical protein